MKLTFFLNLYKNNVSTAALVSIIMLQHGAILHS